MTKPIVFCGRAEAEQLCRRREVPSVLSLIDPHTDEPEVRASRMAECLRFYDFDERTYGYRCVTPRDVNAIITFLNVAPKPILIHCEMGISRSAAAALIGYYLLHRRESRAWAEMLEARLEPRPGLDPNRLILRYADLMLGSKLGAH